MKKAIKLTIAITLCFAMLFQSIGFAIATTVEDPVWTVYDNGTSKIGTGGTLKTINVTKDETTVYTGEDGDGDGYSYKLDGTSYPNYATIKLTVEPQKYYEVSFNFYATQIGTNNSAFSDVIVAKDGAVKQDFSTDYCARVSRGFGYYVNKNSAFVSVPNTTTNFSANAWHSLTVPFYSANNTEVLLAIRPATNNTTVNYIDNIRLKEAEEFAGANDVLSNATTKIYNMTGLTSFANSNLHTGANYTFVKNTTNYTPETDANGDGEVYTMSAACYAQWPSMEMTVEKNQNYELKFKYHASKLGGSNAMFSDIRVVEFGASNAYDSKGNLAAISRDLKTGYLYNKNGVTVDTKINITSGTKTDGWNELTINFYSRNLTKVMLLLRPVIDTATPVSIDDVKLTKVDSFTGSERILSDFTIYDNGTNLLGKGGTVRKPEYGSSYSFANDNLYTEADGDNDGEAYCFTGCSAQWPTAKLALKAKTHYTLSFKYYGTKLDGYEWGDDGMFSDVIVLPDGKAKNVVTDHLGYIGRNDAYYNNKFGNTIKSTDRVNSNAKANQWNTMTVSFYSGDLTEALLAIRPTVATVYVDNIKITEITKLSGSNLHPSGFTVYSATGAAENNEDAGGVISESTSVVHSAGGDGKSIVLEKSCYARYVVMPMAVEKNKYYTLKFWYYSDAVHPTDNSKVFSHIHVSGATGDLNTTALALATTALNGTVYKNGEQLVATKFTTAGATAGAWNEVKISFYSGNNESVRLSVRPATHTDPTKQPSVYLDDITLNNISVSTSYNQKAAIRTADNTDSENIKANGLRTYNAIQADWLSDTEGNIVEYGAIAIRQGYMEKKFEDKTAPDMDMLSLAGQGVGIGVAYRAEGVTTITGSRMMNIHWEKDNADDIFNKHIFTTYLTGIAKANYGEEYLVRSYAIDANGKIYYGETSSISVFKVAQAISNANKAENTYDNEAFKSFVIDSGLADTYAQWCADNSLEVGGLYTSLIAQ